MIANSGNSNESVTGGNVSNEGENGNNGNSNGPVMEGNTNNEDENGNNGQEAEAEVVELSLDHELVQKLHGYFATAVSPWEERWQIYQDADVRVGNVDRDLMMVLAKDNLSTVECKGEHYDALLPDDLKVPENKRMECYAGKDIKDKVKEIFGEDIQLSDGDKIGSVCGGWPYDAQNDEFYEAATGCGGMIPFYVVRNLYAAEKSGDYVYLYERALVVGGYDPNLFHIGDDGESGDLIGPYESKVDASNTDNAESYGDNLKWTFVWDGDNYIFEKLERI